MTNLDDTQPNPVIHEDHGIPAPPRILLWGVIALFILGVIGIFAGVYVFREVLLPSQQQRVIDNLPFMRSFLPRGEALPTAGPVDQEALNELLTSPLNLPTRQPSITPPPEVTAEPSPEPTLEATDEAAAVIAAAPPTHTSEPTQAPATPAPLPTDPPVQVAALSNRPASHINTGFRWEQQTWNNCGPTNITMALSYYGWSRDQSYAAQYLRPQREDKNVSPHELVNFVNERSDVRALYRIGGDIDILRSLIAAGFPVVIETGYMPEGYEWIGHYQTLSGYDDTRGTFYAHDSFLGAATEGGIWLESYTNLDNNWRAFNRVFIVVYEPIREALVMDILNTRADPIQAAEHAFNVAQTEARANPQNGFAWFNMGTSLVALGRYEEAALAFDRSTQVGLPRRMLWYQFGPFEAYYHVGRYEDVILYANNNLTNGAEYVEETYYWQGRAYAAQGRTQLAAEAFRTALRRNRLYTEAQQALDDLNS